MNKEKLLNALTELAEELDKGDEADLGWLTYQGNLVRKVITALQENQ
jgi:hypothetical protein